ncbi:hypothetical protein CR513_46744, partial [Mucuna pruriens]
MKNGESINDYFAQTLTIANKMRMYGEKVFDLSIIEKILCSMTLRYNYVVCSIEESHNLDSMTVDELQSSLLVHEQRMNDHNSHEEQVLKVVQDEASIGRGRGKNVFRGGVTRERGRGRGGIQPIDRATIQYYYYHEFEHFQRVKAQRSHKIAKQTMLKLVKKQCYSWHNIQQMISQMLKRCGCNNHMTGRKDWFSSIVSSFYDEVKLGNNFVLKVAGKGIVKLLINEVMHLINDVFYVLELKNNLFSIGQFMEKGLSIEMKLSHNYSSSMPPAQVWHSCYGHLSYSGLKTLLEHDMVKGLPTFKSPTQFCEHCLKGKHQRDLFPQQSNWYASQLLQLIHFDICGPINPTSYGNKRYILTFIDDLSRKVWVYFLVEKGEALDVFKKFKALVEKQVGVSIQILHTDRGGEYTSKEFVEFLNEQGIQRQLIASYTPQQNGVAKRKNQTIISMVQSALIGRGVPRSFWPKVVNWVIHILNRSPTLVVKNITPKETWSGMKPFVSYFRIFGYIGFVHVPDQKRSKLDDKSTKYVLLGVSEESKAYKLYDSINKKIHIGRDIKFQLDVAWDWGEAKTSRMLDANKLNPMEESCQAAEEVIQTSLNDAAATTSTIVPNSTSNLSDLSLRGVKVLIEGRARK